MSKQQIVAVDLDDVLAANAEGFVSFSNQRWGTKLKAEDFQENLEKLWGIDHDEAQRRFAVFAASDAVSNYTYFEAAQPVLEKLAERYKLVIVTSRRSSLKHATAAWLNLHFKGVFQEVHHSGFYDSPERGGHLRNKGELCREVGADYLIDDHLKHCQAAAEAGVESLLFGDYSWNKAKSLPSGVTRVSDWPAVLDYFDEQG
jgi:uncharacterized HAD superfamily protein